MKTPEVKAAAKEAPAPKADPGTRPAPKADPGTRDAACTAKDRHVSNCSCTGEMRAPMVPTPKKRGR